MSIPRDGVAAPAGRAVEAGARLALEDAGGRAGGLKIRMRTLSSTEPGGEVWKPDLVNANADRAVEDPHAIAYLGELGFGGSAVSLPVTNAGGMLQVSPTDGLTSLTRMPPGRPRSDPVRLRPRGERNFVRLTPNDLLLTEVMLELMRERGTERLAVIFDQEVYGRELAAQIVARARRDGPEPLDAEEYRGKVDEIPDIVDRVAAGQPGRRGDRRRGGAGHGPHARGAGRAPARHSRLRHQRHARARPAPADPGRAAERRGAHADAARARAAACRPRGDPARGRARRAGGRAARGGLRLRGDAPHPRRRRARADATARGWPRPRSRCATGAP